MSENFSVFRVVHGPLPPDAESLKQQYINAIRGGLSLGVCIRMSLNAIEVAEQRHGEPVSDDSIVENMVLLLAAWAEVHGRKLKETHMEPDTGDEAMTSAARGEGHDPEPFDEMTGPMPTARQTGGIDRPPTCPTCGQPRPTHAAPAVDPLREACRRLLDWAEGCSSITLGVDGPALSAIRTAMCGRTATARERPCPRCGETMEHQPPRAAEPDVGLPAWRGGYVCLRCGHHAENAPIDREGERA